MQGSVNALSVTGTEKLGDQHRGTAGQADEKSVEQIDQRGGGTYGCQGLGTYEAADDNVDNGGNTEGSGNNGNTGGGGFEG